MKTVIILMCVVIGATVGAFAGQPLLTEKKMIQLKEAQMVAAGECLSLEAISALVDQNKLKEALKALLDREIKVKAAKAKQSVAGK